MTSECKICIVTAARSEYGLLRWLMQEIKDDPAFKLQLVVTASHLSREFGLTYKEIENDGFYIDEKVEMLISSVSQTGIVKSMGLCAIGFADAFERLKPDLVFVLGDRYELLPICSTAVVMNIPIAHISGGDVTEGAIDDQVRHAVTKMSSIHFPGTIESANRIVQMGENPGNVFNVGELGLDNFNRQKLLSKSELAQHFSLDINKKWVLMTYHPETMISLQENLKVVENLIICLNELVDFQIIITKSNADFGGTQINDYLDQISKVNSNKFRLFDSLGQIKYNSLMKNVYLVIGNSSSGIIEAPFLKCRVINIGNRQKGRIISNNILTCNGTITMIKEYLKKIQTPEFEDNLKNVKNPYGQGDSTDQIMNVLRMRKDSFEIKKGFFTVK